MSHNLTLAGGAKGEILRVSAIVLNGASLASLKDGFAKRALASSDIIFEPSFTGRLARKAARIANIDALCLANFRVLGSDVESNIFDAATRDIAKIAIALDDVRVSKVETGAAWALGLRPLIFRELYAAYAFQEMLKQNHKTITIVMKRLGSVESAFVTRLMAYSRAGEIEFTGLSQLQADTLSPAEPKNLHVSLARLRQMRRTDDPAVAPCVAERIVGDLNVFVGENPSPSDILILHLTGSQMFHANIPPILSALKAKEKSAVVLAMTESGIDIYDEVAKDRPHNIVRLKDGQALKSTDQVSRMRHAIRDRVNRLAGQIIGLDSLSPILAANDDSYVDRTVSALLVFHHAFNVLLGRAKPIALYMSQSPDTHPLAYLAVSIGSARLTPYYSFSAFVTEDARSVPFIAPAFLLAYGDHDRDVLSKRNKIAGDNAIVTGMPSLDHIVVQDNDVMRQKLIDDLGIQDEKSIISIKTGRLDAEKEDRWIAPFMRWADGQNICVILAESSRGGTKSYDGLLKMAQTREWTNVISMKGIEATNLALAGSHIVVSDQPEHALAGMIAGRVFIHVKINAERVDGLGEGTGFVARSENELRDIVSGVLLDEDYVPDALIQHRKQLQTLLNQDNQGVAAQNVVEALLAEREKVKFESPFVESRLNDTHLTKLDVVPRLNLL